VGVAEAEPVVEAQIPLPYNRFMIAIPSIILTLSPSDLPWVKILDEIGDKSWSISQEV